MGIDSDLLICRNNEISGKARLAFEAAQKRKRIATLADKSNVLASSRLWRKEVKSLSGDYLGSC